MQTLFTLAQLAEPGIAEADGILRKCVHCGFCTATCPTFVLLGDELDSPRGRIYLIKNMLESGAAPTEETVRHLDRCLTCLSCMTTCPSGVNYMHLADVARAEIETRYRRPLSDRLLRWLLATVMPRPGLFRLALRGAKLASPFTGLVQSFGGKRLAALLDLVPERHPKRSHGCGPGTYPAAGPRKGRVALLMGCVQSVLDPGINAATIRLLTRLGYDVVVVADAPCCGSLAHHMGREAEALASARRSIDQWITAKVEAVIVTASGCGTTIKDYGHMLKGDAAYAEKAGAVSAMARDISEFLGGLELPQLSAKGLRVTYHSACSLQHGQQVKALPQKLLRRAGFEVADVPEGHLCCGSAGTYNILQPDIARQLRDRKIANIATTMPEVIAAGNIGCLTQIGSGVATPVVHTAELLDWAYGGPRPAALGG
jgi:glycolate oxidase iron-sulfur subunit